MWSMDPLVAQSIMLFWFDAQQLKYETTSTSCSKMAFFRKQFPCWNGSLNYHIQTPKILRKASQFGMWSVVTWIKPQACFYSICLTLVKNHSVDGNVPNKGGRLYHGASFEDVLIFILFMFMEWGNISVNHTQTSTYLKYILLQSIERLISFYSC